MSGKQYDAAVIGAGPYGLSTAAHLLGRGLKVIVFGKPFELWRCHMPKGMRLRSHWWATHLADPRNAYGFDRFFAESEYKECYPEPVNVFVDYGTWFQRRAVPDIDETYVTNMTRSGSQFVLTLADGREVRAAAVVMAIGLLYYAYRPAEFSNLPAATVSHTSEHNDFSRFAGKRVMVVGGGQSALESSALLYEVGATVHNVSRRPIDWLAPDREGQRTLLQRIKAPRSGIAPGWINWFLHHVPYSFNRLPQSKKDRWLRPYLSAGVSGWVRDRVIGKVHLHEGRTIDGLRMANGAVEVTLSDGVALTVDHVLLATGYKVDLDKLTMISPALRSEIKAHTGAPVLNPWFESSVPGLYFVGLSSLSSFGPLYRFVAGCRATAPRVARHIARRKKEANRVALRARIKLLVARTASWSRVDMIAQRTLHRNVPFTASYHRVVEHLETNGGFALPAMEISTAMLEHHLDWIARNFRIVSLNDFAMESGRASSLPCAAVTFDDGYSDIFHYAFPLLKRKGIPAGIFVVTDLVGSGQPPMHELLHALLSESSRRGTLTASQLTSFLGEARAIVPIERVSSAARDSFSSTRLLLQTLTHADLERIIERLKAALNLGQAWSRGLEPLNWEMVLEMQKAGMTIGSHSRTHAFLANESDERAHEEAESSRGALQRRLGVLADWFAYPGGSFNTRVVRAVEKAGYRYAFTDCHHRDRQYPWLTLPRKTMWERSCVDGSGRFSPAIMSCHAATLFERFSGCRNDH